LQDETLIASSLSEKLSTAGSEIIRHPQLATDPALFLPKNQFSTAGSKSFPFL
jgi:hypothetical protein